MKIRVKFTSFEVKDVSWWRDIESFPPLINFKGKNYEWAMYDKDLTGTVDWVLIFSELPSYDKNYKADCPVWEHMFDSKNDCECGAAMTSFSWDHMRYCKKWEKW